MGPHFAKISKNKQTSKQIKNKTKQNKNKTNKETKQKKKQTNKQNSQVNCILRDGNP